MSSAASSSCFGQKEHQMRGCHSLAGSDIIKSILQLLYDRQESTAHEGVKIVARRVKQLYCYTYKAELERFRVYTGQHRKKGNLFQIEGECERFLDSELFCLVT